MEQLAVRRLGSGPPVVLVHGGVGPRMTWERQAPLADSWELVIPSRRGFAPSPPTDRQDFERDASDLIPLLGPDGAHLVGFSYGGVSAVIATLRAPDLVRSLTVVEAPLYGAAPDDPGVARLAAMGDAYLAGQSPAEEEREFIRLAGLEGAGPEHAAEIAEAVAAARGGRPPSDAAIDYDELAGSGISVLVVSGGHNDALEGLSDQLAARLGAERAVIEGAGHAAQRAPGFNEALEAFLRRAEAAR
jgi:pimeloyl-ACP methyl ester carboxylesterase